MTAHQAAKVAVVDDHALFAESLEIALNLEGFRTTRILLDEQNGSPSRLLDRILRLSPHIALIDLDLGNAGDGARLVRPLALAGIATVVVTGSTRREQWGECIANGARTVIAKLAPLADILGTIRRIDGGLPVLSASEREQLLRQWQDSVAKEQAIRTRLEELTKGEAEVLGMLMSGLQVSDIARQRFVAESTVRTQVKSVLSKLQVSSQLTAVGVANRVAWRPPSALRTGSAGESQPAKPTLISQRRAPQTKDHQR